MKKVAAVLGAFLFPLVAQAGGMDLPENGTWSLARGGANVAAVADPSALALNPAGLASVKGFQLLFDNNLWRPNLCFTRAGTYPGDPGPGTYAGQPFPKVCRMNEGAYYVPMVAATYDFGLRNWTFALGGYGPHALGRKHFPRQVVIADSEGGPVLAPGPTRYDVLNQDVLVIFFTLAAAWHVADWLDLGFALQPTLSEVRFSMAVPYQPPNLDPDQDIFFAIHTYGFGMTALFGAKVRPIRSLEMGLSLRLPAKSTTRGDATIRMPPSVANLGGAALQYREDTEVAMSSELPLYLRLGLRYRWFRGEAELADLELDAQWERWSAVRTMDTKVLADLIGNPLTVFVVPHLYSDTVSLRLGSSVTLPWPVWKGRIALALGLFYDSSASPKAYTRLDYQAFSLIGVTGGVAWRLPWVDLHLAVAYVVGGRGWPWNFRRKPVVERSCVVPIDPYESLSADRCNPYGDDWDETLDVGRGTYELSYFIASLGFTVHIPSL